MALIFYSKDNLQFKILSDTFYIYLSNLFKDISKSTIINNDRKTLIYECFPIIRDTEQKVTVELVFLEEAKEKYFDKLKVTSDSKNLNEYDLADFANTILQKLYTSVNNKQKKKFCVRNYCTYFNRFPMQIDLVVNGAYKVRIHSYDFNSKRISTESLTEQILMVDTEILAVDINEALSVSYNNTNNLCALLSVLLDVGIKPIKSEYRIFVTKCEEKMMINRYRTGFADFEWGLSVKDNLSGLTTLLEGDNKFMGNFVLTFMDEKQNRIGSTIVQNQNDKDEIEQIFLNKKISKNTGNTVFCNEINDLTHFPATEIKIPKQIRKYIKNIELLDNKDLFLSASRLYNISLLCEGLGTTVAAAYKVSCIEALAKTEKLAFSAFMQKYYTDKIDKKLLDYYYGTIRSGHFHSGEFYFNEYNVTMQFDTDFGQTERRDNYLKFNNAIRGAFINWIKLNILKENCDEEE